MNRHGQNNKWIANWVEDSQGMRVHDHGHTIIGNRGDIRIMAGDCDGFNPNASTGATLVRGAILYLQRYNTICYKHRLCGFGFLLLQYVCYYSSRPNPATPAKSGQTRGAIEFTIGTAKTNHPRFSTGGDITIPSC